MGIKTKALTAKDAKEGVNTRWVFLGVLCVLGGEQVFALARY